MLSKVPAGLANVPACLLTGRDTQSGINILQRHPHNTHTSMRGKLHQEIMKGPNQTPLSVLMIFELHCPFCFLKWQIFGTEVAVEFVDYWKKD
jgi:hypothetical protein